MSNVSILQSDTEERLVALIEELIKLPSETEWVEFKRNNSDAEQTGRLISALSNTSCINNRAYGYVLWGIDDATHEICGTSFEPGIAKRGNQPLELWLAQSLKPSPTFAFKSINYKSVRIIILEITPASSVPVKFQGISYIRIGSATPKIEDYPERERDLLGKLKPFVWENTLAKMFVEVKRVFESLDFRILFSLMQKQIPSNEENILEYLQEEHLIIKDVGGRWNITNLGGMLFAKRLEEFDSLTRKALRIVQYDGNSRLKTKKILEVGKGYASGFMEILKYVDDNLPSEEIFTNGIRSRKRMYPELAIRELVANALVHQDMTITGAGPILEIFDNRIEITNPGIPVTDIVKKLFHAPPRSRNEKMARLLRRMGICEELGTGLIKIVDEAERFRLPAPDFKVVDDSTRVVLFGFKTFSELTREERIAICYQHTCLQFHNGKRMTNASLRERFDIDEKNAAQVSRIIRDAQNSGMIILADLDRPKAGYKPFWA